MSYMRFVWLSVKQYNSYNKIYGCAYELPSLHFADIYFTEKVTLTFPLPSTVANPSGLSILPNRV